MAVSVMAPLRSASAPGVALSGKIQATVVEQSRIKGVGRCAARPSCRVHVALARRCEENGRRTDGAWAAAFCR